MVPIQMVPAQQPLLQAAGAAASCPADESELVQLPPPPSHPVPGEWLDHRRAQTLEIVEIPECKAYRITWIVDARKLTSSDREAVSPGFELTLTTPAAQTAQFKMIL